MQTIPNEISDMRNLPAVQTNKQTNMQATVHTLTLEGTLPLKLFLSISAYGLIFNQPCIYLFFLLFFKSETMQHMSKPVFPNLLWIKSCLNALKILICLPRPLFWQKLWGVRPIMGNTALNQRSAFSTLHIADFWNQRWITDALITSQLNFKTLFNSPPLPLSWQPIGLRFFFCKYKK